VQDRRFSAILTGISTMWPEVYFHVSLCPGHATQSYLPTYIWYLKLRNGTPVNDMQIYLDTQGEPEINYYLNRLIFLKFPTREFLYKILLGLYTSSEPKNDLAPPNATSSLSNLSSVSGRITDALTASAEVKSVEITIMENSERMKLGLFETGELFRCKKNGIIFGIDPRPIALPPVPVLPSKAPAHSDPILGQSQQHFPWKTRQHQLPSSGSRGVRLACDILPLSPKEVAPNSQTSSSATP